MAEGLQATIERARDNTVRLREARQLLTGPLETWPVTVLRGVLLYTCHSVEDIVTVAQGEGGLLALELRSTPLYEKWLLLKDVYELLGMSCAVLGEVQHLRKAEEFYRRMLDMNHGTVGQVIGALNSGKIPADLVKEAAVGAYFHRPVREAIKAGYGITPLEPPKSSSEKPI